MGFDYSKNREMLDSALKMYKMINSIQTPGIVVYAGKVVGNAYSTFAASKVLNENTVLLLIIQIFRSNSILSVQSGYSKH